MAFDNLTATEIEVGKAVKKDLFRKIKDSLADLDTRATALEGGSGAIDIFNTDVFIGNNPQTAGVAFWEAPFDLTLTECAIQIFARGVVTSGTLTIDIKKNSTPNPTGMTSVFTSAPTMNLASVSDYNRSTGTFNPTYQDVLAGEILRFDITSLPTNLTAFRLILKGGF
jgi:hypothetical protein